MLSQTNVDHYASASQIDTYVAERDVVLTYVLKILDDAGLLEKLAFKGGTCLKKVYYGKTTRFSEDPTEPKSRIIISNHCFPILIAGYRHCRHQIRDNN